MPAFLKIAVFVLMVNSVFPESSEAYIDPGTGNAVSGAFAAILPAIAVVFGFLIRPFKLLIRKLIAIWGKRKSSSKEIDN